MQSRRKFVLAGGATAVLASTGLPKRLFAQSAPNPTIYNAAIAAQAIATGNATVTVPTASDWITVQNTMNACISEWTANSRDAGVAAAISNMSPSIISTARLVQSLLVSEIQLYNPRFNQADLTQVLAAIDANSNLVPQVLNGIKTNGMSFYMGVASNQAFKIAKGLSSGAIPSASIRSQLAARRSAGVALPGVTCQVCGPNEPPGGGGGYNCKTDGALLAAAGVAFLTLSIMTLGSVDVLAGAAWGGISLWGGIGTGVWGAGHTAACGF